MFSIDLIFFLSLIVAMGSDWQGLVYFSSNNNDFSVESLKFPLMKILILIFSFEDLSVQFVLRLFILNPTFLI